MSSTTSARAPRAWICSDPGSALAPASRGIRRKNVEPRPGALSTPTEPPMRSASARLTASPSPVPGMAEFLADLSRENRMKRFRCSSRGIPAPSSATAKTTSPRSRRAESAILLPPNLREFTAKLTITCWIRAASPVTMSGSAGSTAASMRTSPARGASILTTASSTSRGLNGDRAILYAPASMAAKSRTSSTSDARKEAQLRRVETSSCCSGASGVSDSARADPEDAAHRIADLMAHARDELRLRGVGLLELARCAGGPSPRGSRARRLSELSRSRRSPRTAAAPARANAA